jgi:hypothetical protein
MRHGGGGQGGTADGHLHHECSTGGVFHAVLLLTLKEVYRMSTQSMTGESSS